MIATRTDTIAKRQMLLIRIICLFWFASKLVTYKSWIAERDLPTVSFFKAFDALPASIHFISFIVCMSLLLLLLLRPSKSWMLIFIFLEIFSVILDVLRVQPWEYLYLFIFASYLAFRNRPLFFYRFLLMLLASTYIFSGLHKINGAFLHNIWDNFFLRKVFHYTAVKIPIALHYSGLTMGFGEFSGGLLLLAMKRKRLAVAGLIGMHAFILAFVNISLGQPQNSVVPWNIMMILLLLYVVSYPVQDGIKAVNNKMLPPFALGILLVFWYILPFSNLFGYWVHPLSSGMYTGKTPSVYICWQGMGQKDIPEAYSLKRNPKNICKGDRILSLKRWTMQMAQQAPYTQMWYFERLGGRLREKYPADSIRLYYSYYPNREIKEIK